uniref:MHC class I-like antigen recognition-like domain-containing protein n=1 Tax=Piliocolobus tephrosceles TaxID=591936 RepID=A0A8C9IX82_9PRIM
MAALQAQEQNTHSLWYNFTIIRLPRHGQQWCEVQDQVDQKNFLSYDCGSDKVLSMGHLEEQLDAADAWGKQLEMLREVGQRLRLELADTELEDFTPSGPLTLQARMSYEYETDRRIRGSRQFGFVGQKFLLFDSNNRKWTVVQARARQMKEKWEKDSGLTMFFQVFSMGDCKSWLRDFPMHRKKRLEPTGNCQGSTGSTLEMPSSYTLLSLRCFHFRTTHHGPRHSPYQSHGHQPQSLETPHHSLLHPPWYCGQNCEGNKRQMGEVRGREREFPEDHESHSTPSHSALSPLNEKKNRHRPPTPQSLHVGRNCTW